MNKVFAFVVGTATAAASAATLAGGPAASYASAPAFTPVFYASAAAGYGMSEGILSKDDNNHLKSNGVKYKRSSFVWNAVLGYQITKMVSVEAGYMSLPKIKYTYSDKSENDTLLLKRYAITADAKVSYPLASDISAFGKLGFAYQKETDSLSVKTTSVSKGSIKAHRITPMYGVGVDYNLNSTMAVSLEGLSTLRTGLEFPATYSALVGFSYKFA